MYGKLLRGPQDVEEALIALESAFAPMLLTGVTQARAAGMWQEATVEGLHSLMELPGEPPAEGPIGTTYAECPPFGCEEHRGGGFVPSGAERWSGLPAPALDVDLEDVIIGVVQAITCCGGGGGDPDPPGGGCPGCCCCCQLERTTKLAEHDGHIIAAAACCSGSSCDDGNACTEVDLCGPRDGCEICGCCGTPKDCDDGNPCTMNACHPSTGDCITTPRHGASCPDEGDPCTQNICQYASCIHPPLCTNGNSCCQEGGLTTCCAVCCYNPLHCCNAGTTCCGSGCCGDDGDLCTDDECNAGVCEHPPKSCDDGNECTFDFCDPEIGCVNPEGACESTCCMSSMDMPYCCEPEQTVCCMYLDHCCGDGEICCGEEECCLQGETCCEERECCSPEETCFHGHCCAEPDPNDIDCDGIPNDDDDDMDGDGIPNDEDPCPEDADPCCGNPDPCCGDHDPCCGSPDPCCGVTCNDGDSCTDDQCVDGACWYTLNDEPGCACCTAQVAAAGSQTCDGCVSSGKLEGGSITVSKAVVCSGQELTFTLTGVEDFAGKKRVNCVEVPIQPVTPTYTWRIAKPGGTVTGSGNVATVTAGASGIYSCRFTANAPRECAPPERKIGPKAAKAVKIDLIEIQNQTATPIGPGLSIPPKTNIAAAIRGTGDILLQAKLSPPVAATDLPSETLTWTGGSEVANNQLQRTVSKSAWAKHTVRVDCSATHYTTLVYVLGAEPTGYSPTNGTSGAHFPDNERGYATTGLLPVDQETGRAEGRCEIQFTIRPDAMVADANNGVFAASDIRWDVSRDKQRKRWRKSGTIWSLVDNLEQWTSDDTLGDTEEDNNPWNGNGHLYGNDSPDWYELNADAWVRKLNMREWVRVQLGNPNPPSWLMCSDYYYWHVFQSIARQNGIWVNESTYGNEIPPGNVFWGEVPLP